MQGLATQSLICASNMLSPYYGLVPDTILVDKAQAELFATLGRGRGLFRGVARWPHLNEEFKRVSRKKLLEAGETQWSVIGGVLGPDGEPTCQPTSSLASDVVHGLAGDPGGVLWTDTDGTVWAVRLIPRSRGDTSTLYGFALGWKAQGPPTEQARFRSRCHPDRKAQSSTLEIARPALANRAHPLRLAGRAEQILWVLHHAVLRQRRSVVLLPDVLVGQVIFGGDRGSWPKDWRNDLFETFRSLTELRAEVLRLRDGGWRPELGACSVAVAGIDKLWVTRPQDDVCLSCCPMAASGQPHHHFLVDVGRGFLKTLELFATDVIDGCRLYDFNRMPVEEYGKELKQARNAGQLVSVSGPSTLFGSAKWSALTPDQNQVIEALLQEVTRAYSGRSGRADRAEVLTGCGVPGLVSRSEVECPLLAGKGNVVAFNGNRDRRGMGYLIVGHRGRGWLHKCGYAVPEEGRALAAEIRRFFSDLRVVQEILGLTVAGLRQAPMEWLALDDLVAMARPSSLPTLLTVHLRVYGPEDYLARVRSHYEKQGAFRVIPGADVSHDETVPVESRITLDLPTRLRRAGITQVELAARLNVTQPYVSQMMRGKRRWQANAIRCAEELITERTVRNRSR